MPFATQTFTQLQSQIIADIIASGNAPNGLLPESVYAVLAPCIAEMANEHMDFLRYMALQITPATATDEYLDMWGSLKSVLRNGATASTATAQFTGTNAVFPQGVTVQVNGSTIGFQTTASGSIANGIALIPVQALSTGSNTNFGANTALTMVNSITGANTAVTLYTAATGGSDPETDTNYRTRVLAAYAALGNNGNLSDFIAWAKAVPGVTRAWVNPWGAGDGSVVVYIMLDTQNAANNGFPLGTDGVSSSENRWGNFATGDQLTVANYLYPLQPLGLVVVCSPIPQPITVTIQSLSITNTITVQNNILTALQSYITSVGSPTGCTIYTSQIEAAIQGAVGGTVTFNLVAPATNITTSTGYLPYITSANINYE